MLPVPARLHVDRDLGRDVRAGAGVEGPAAGGGGDRWWRGRRDGDRRSGRRRSRSARRSSSPLVPVAVVLAAVVVPSVVAVRSSCRCRWPPSSCRRSWSCRRRRRAVGGGGRSVGRLGDRRRCAAVDRRWCCARTTFRRSWSRCWSTRPDCSCRAARPPLSIHSVRSSRRRRPGLRPRARRQRSRATQAAALRCAADRPSSRPSLPPTPSDYPLPHQYLPARAAGHNLARIPDDPRGTLRERGWDLPPGKTSLQSSRKGCSMGPTTGAGRGCAVIRRGG